MTGDQAVTAQSEPVVAGDDAAGGGGGAVVVSTHDQDPTTYGPEVGAGAGVAACAGPTISHMHATTSTRPEATRLNTSPHDRCPGDSPELNT